MQVSGPKGGLKKRVFHFLSILVPEMNAIEGVWMPLRIAITKEWNTPYTIEWTNCAQKAKQEKFPQDRIRALVVRQAVINSLIIEFKGGNKFYG